MHVISQSALRKFWEKHPDAETSLRYWYKIATIAEWSNLAEVKSVFSSADRVGNFTVFNIRGNNYRLITFIDYEFKPKKFFIRAVLTHEEYDEDKWKKDPWYE
ncbi:MULTISPECIES: type II toxin-antitoxin system HigB family toxin [unclassified Microcoleus]|uniref:type II toxin-antitoxin system HigB family toxin n=1 Tax=unclassified Microcoleus TaxID=2642155 RepID=UPI002FD71BF6